VKEEILDLSAILESIHTKEKIEAALNATLKKKQSNQVSLDKLNQGKKTITNFWKSQS
jgi:Tfp pilus assembly protein PilO